MRTMYSVEAQMPIQLRVRLPFALVDRADDQVQFAQPRQFAHGLVHEHAAAVDRRADRIGRDEQNAQRVRARARSGSEGVAKMAAQRPAERFACRRSPASARARERETKRRGSCSDARAMPAKLARSGESPTSQLSIAPAQVKKKCDISRRQS